MYPLLLLDVFGLLDALLSDAHILHLVDAEPRQAAADDSGGCCGVCESNGVRLHALAFQMPLGELR